MKARYSITIKYEVFQDVAGPDELQDMGELADMAACCFADLCADSGAVASFEIVENKMEAKA